MPRYFISTANHFEVMDEEGVELPDREALRSLLRRTLTQLLQDEGEIIGADDFRARVYDENGKLVMQVQASFFVVDQ